MNTLFTLRSHAFFKETTLPCRAGWWDACPLFMFVIASLHIKLSQSISRNLVMAGRRKTRLKQPKPMSDVSKTRAVIQRQA